MALNVTGGSSAGRRILLATLVAGTLDILAAAGMTLFHGGAPAAMLRVVASGPFPNATQWGAGGSALGLATHFALMAIMATVFVIAADRRPALKRSPIAWGVIYGIGTYVVMNLIVVPLRFGGGFPPSLMAFVSQLAFHIFLVGLPIALIARR